MKRSGAEAKAEAGLKLTCQARTKRGDVCRAFVLPGSRFCFGHDPSRESERRQARAKGGIKASKLRAIEGRRSKLSTAAELLAFGATIIHDVIEEKLPPDTARVAIYGLTLQHRLIEATDLERRLAALEAQAAETAERGARRW